MSTVEKAKPIGKSSYQIDITITCYFSGYYGYSIKDYASSNGAKSTHTHSIIVHSLENISYENLVFGQIYGGGHRNGNPSNGTPAAFYTIDKINIKKLS